MIAALLLTLSLALAAQPDERVTDIAVHGNTLTPDAEIISLSGLTIGMPVDAHTVDAASERLRATRRFERVEVLKRYASIADLSQVMIVIVVDEGPVKIVPTRNGTPARVEKGGGVRLMYLPVLRYEDGYGFTYGLRVSVANPLGKGTRLSLPATWGGEKRAAAELEKTFTARAMPFTRLLGGVAVSKRTNPFFEADDNRRAVWARAERNALRWLRTGISTGYDHVSFIDAIDHFTRIGADAVVDTRLEPMLPRNAVYGRAAWDYLSFGSGGTANRIALDGRGYVGLFGQSVLVVRATREDSDHPLPPYLKPMLGGMDNVRGFERGSAIGDTLVTSSVELRQPLSSPLSVAKLGVTAFFDAGAVYPKGERLADQAFARGVGGGVWLSLAVLQLNLSVAHGLGASTRVHFGTAVSF